MNNKAMIVYAIALIIVASPWLLIGLSGIIYELFGPVGYERMLNLLHVKLTLGQIQLIGLISFVVTIILVLIRRVMIK